MTDENPNRKPRVGVVALQGDYAAHADAIRAVGGDAFEVRTPDEAASADAFILPGGESTTIGKLMTRYGVDTALRDAHAAGKPIYGTCAGMILLARTIGHGAMRGGQPTLGLMDISVTRNAWGRQIDSFETDIDAPEVGDGVVRGVFIRAPLVEAAGPDVQILARHDGQIVLVRQGSLLASSFHPELTRDGRVHRYFLEMISLPATDDAAGRTKSS